MTWQEELQGLTTRLDAYIADSSKTPSESDDDDAYDEGEKLAPSVLKTILSEACSILRAARQAHEPDTSLATEEIAAFVDRTVNVVYSDKNVGIDFLPSFAHAEGGLAEDSFPNFIKLGKIGGIDFVDWFRRNIAPKDLTREDDQNSRFRCVGSF